MNERIRWGRYVAWLGLALWVAATALLVPLAGKTAEATSTDPTLALPRRAEVTRALVREREAFPDTDTPVAVVVYVRDSGITTEDRATVEAGRALLAPLVPAHPGDPAVPRPAR